MGAIKLELGCPKNVNGISADPQPDWSIDTLLSELDSIYQKQKVAPDFPAQSGASGENSHCARGFHMHVSDESDSDDDCQEEPANSSIVSGRRFVCDEFYMSGSDSDDGCQLMDKVGLAEGALHELIDEFQFSLSEEVRSKISSLDSQLVYENVVFASSTTKTHKHREQQRERERKFDLQYQRTIAEALDNHLSVVQRDHEHVSQLEERKIRDDVAREEAKRKEKAFQQERNKVEEEARLKAERAKAAATEESEKKAAEAAVAEALRNSAQNASNSALDVKKEVKPSGINLIRASENALILERQRSQIYREFRSFKARANQDYNKHGQNISRQIRTISATVENIRTRAEELVKLISTSEFPQPISIQFFAEKMVSNCTNQRSSNALFAIARVIVVVTSKIPQAMDILLAELNRVCIYTVPKHIIFSQEVYSTKDAYFKAIGYKEENGNIEGIDDYVERLKSYMRLYGALVQTEVPGFQNLHGLKEGWSWLARHLNAVPANLYTAAALDSFLEMAGFALYRRYRNQFEKLLGIVSRDFVNALKDSEEPVQERTQKMSQVKMSLLTYIEKNQFKNEPEGLQLRDHLESNDVY